jgi:hypothetical protein
MQFGRASGGDVRKNTYSKDLRPKVLAVVDRGTPRKEAVETLGVSLAVLKGRLKRRLEDAAY